MSQGGLGLELIKVPIYTQKSPVFCYYQIKPYSSSRFTRYSPVLGSWIKVP